MYRLDDPELIDAIIKTIMFTHSFNIFIKCLLCARYCFKPCLYIRSISPNRKPSLLSAFHAEDQKGRVTCPVVTVIQCGVRMGPRWFGSPFHTISIHQHPPRQVIPSPLHPGASPIGKRSSDLKNSDAHLWFSLSTERTRHRKVVSFSTFLYPDF